MNCSPSICIALLMLSLAAGMFLLYKTRKEVLGTFFKIVSWFIIVVSIGAMIHCSIWCIIKCCRQQCGTEMCGLGGLGECGPGGMQKRVMIYKGGDADECSMRGKGCCKDEMECEEEEVGCAEAEMDCCKKGGHEKMEVVKDSIVVKKK